jgi:23S rRNA-/tRNA-specific pseudouridylate synthase
VVYHDNDLLVAYKPAQLPSTASRAQSHCSLHAYIIDYVHSHPPSRSLPIHLPSTLSTTTTSDSKRNNIGSRSNSNSNSKGGTKVHIPSRLDVGVQGLIPMSISQRMNGVLHAMFDKHTIDKCYLYQSICQCPQHHRKRKPISPIRSGRDDDAKADDEPLLKVARTVTDHVANATISTPPSSSSSSDFSLPSVPTLSSHTDSDNDVLLAKLWRGDTIEVNRHIGKVLFPPPPCYG